MPVAVIIINSNNDGDKEIPRAVSAPPLRWRRRAGRGGGGGGVLGEGGEAGAAFPRKTKGSGGRGESGREGRRGSFPAVRHLLVGLRGGWCGGGKAAGLGGGQLSTGALGEDVSGRGCGGAGGSRSTRGRSAEGKGGEGVYRPLRGGGSILGHPAAASFGTPATGVGYPRVGFRWVRPSRDPATATSFSPPPSPRPQVSRDPLRAAAMSRRSQRLVTTRYYPGDDDATTSSSSASLLGGTQLPFKETAGRLVDGTRGGSPLPKSDRGGAFHPTPGTFLGEVWA